MREREHENEALPDLSGVVAAALAPLVPVRAVIVRADGAGARRLVVEVLPESGPAGDEDDEAVVVESWQAVFEDAYGLVADDDGPEAGRLAGWTDSFTGRPIGAAHMAEWVETTVERLARLGPRAVLEIGAGTGLLARPLVERLGVREYTATDFSAEAVRLLRRLGDDLRRGRPEAVITVAEAAADVPAPPAAAPGGYDTAVVNSVVQYFPSVTYLESVIAATLPRMAPGGHVFLGDLRDSRLLEHFAVLKHELRREPGPVSGLRLDHVAVELAGDVELSVDPGYLADLPRRFPAITAVELAPRLGAAPTEMTLFRYDAVLHVGCPAPAEAGPWRPAARIGLDELDWLLAGDAAGFGVSGIANARLGEARRLHAARRAEPVDGPCAPGLDPEAVHRLAERHGRPVRLRWSLDGRPGDYDAWFPGLDADEQAHYRVAVPAAAPGAGCRQQLVPPAVSEEWRRAVREALARHAPDAGEPPEVEFVLALG
ncbi:class I SAM-dependent methyltransferase [Kitasatospora sp. NPDC048722]|uniref:class I SAM-dependent methyltransferase n=1 Tax=Kitasatospora sp. NPDC048722 TaxID=3155639 RepID=UPI0033FC0455